MSNVTRDIIGSGDIREKLGHVKVEQNVAGQKLQRFATAGEDLTHSWSGEAKKYLKETVGTLKSGSNTVTQQMKKYCRIVGDYANEMEAINAEADSQAGGKG